MSEGRLRSAHKECRQKAQDIAREWWGDCACEDPLYSEEGGLEPPCPPCRVAAVIDDELTFAYESGMCAGLQVLLDAAEGAPDAQE